MASSGDVNSPRGGEKGEEGVSEQTFPTSAIAERRPDEQEDRLPGCLRFQRNASLFSFSVPAYFGPFSVFDLARF
eukprot:7202082-Prymnesium_polylepis.1